MNVLSLCTGYGGLDLAVEAVIPGAWTRWVADIDRDACAVQASRFPGAEQLGDLKTIDWPALAGQVDIITAGYPCQPFSQAGRRKGIDDERHLWPWVADAVRVLRPRLVVLENVRGHLVLGFDTVLADLADLGLSARWGIVRASDAGAPHQRARLFVAAFPGDCASDASGPDGGASQLASMAAATVTAAEPGERHSHAATNTQGTGRYFGPGLSPTQRRAGPASSGPIDSCTATNTVGEGSQGHDGVERQHAGCGGMGDQTDWGKFAPAVERWERIMGSSAPAALVDGKQLNAKLVEWMMGLPDGWVTDLIPNRRALKVLGNGVVPQQAMLALRTLL